MKKNVESSLLITDSPVTGAILKQNRHFYGLTQAQSAALIHVSTKTWCQYEQNRRTMHAAFYELWLLKANMVDK